MYKQSILGVFTEDMYMKKLLLGLILLSSVNFVGASEHTISECINGSSPCTTNSDCLFSSCINGCCMIFAP